MKEKILKIVGYTFLGLIYTPLIAAVLTFWYLLAYVGYVKIFM